MNPTREELAIWLTERQHPQEWADFLTGLPWHIIKPGVKIAVASKIHPAVALASAAAYTGDQQVRATIQAHLARDPGTPAPPPTPNRAARRAAGRRTRPTR